MVLERLSMSSTLVSPVRSQRTSNLEVLLEGRVLNLPGTAGD